METLGPNIFQASGYLSRISQPYFKGVHEILELILDCEDRGGNPSTRNLQIKAWDDQAKMILENFREGDRVTIRAVVYSHRNRNNENLWYHVVSLREITKK